MTWPQFCAAMTAKGHANPSPATFRRYDGRSFGPVMWRVAADGKQIEMKDKPGVLADILAAF